jgi:hypothetical protein
VSEMLTSSQYIEKMEKLEVKWAAASDVER